RARARAARQQLAMAPPPVLYVGSMDVAQADLLLTTTRSVRKRLDLLRPVEPVVIERAIEIALPAPTGSNSQGWHFVVVTDAEKRAGLAALYRRAFQAYVSQQVPGRPQLPPEDPRARQLPRILDSATYLAEHLHEVPVHVLPCVEGLVENAGPLAQASVYGSILPAVWSFMLGLGVDHAPHHVRAGGGGAPRHPAERDPGSVAAGGVLHRRRLQDSEAPART